MLQCVAVCCSVLQRVVASHQGATPLQLQHAATCCNILKHTATCYNTLQHTRTCCNILQHTRTCCNILQHTRTCCNILQHTRTCCNILQHMTYYVTSIRWCGQWHRTKAPLRSCFSTLQLCSHCNTPQLHSQRQHSSSSWLPWAL